MNFRDLSPTLSDFENCNWKEAIEAAKTREYTAYWDSLNSKAKEAQEAEDERAQIVFTLLIAATSLHLKEPNNSTSPFCPMFTSPEGRTADVDDFTDRHLEVFGQLIERIEDPELRARIADIVWVRKRDYRAAEQAVSAYLESARRLEDTRVPWPPCLDRIKRAVTVAVLHGRNTQMFKQVIAHIEETLERHKANDPSYLSADLMEILLEQKEGDNTNYAQLAERHAVSAQDDEDWARPQRYLNIEARWLERAEDESGSRRARIRAAEAYVCAAKTRLSHAQPDHLTAAKLIESAIVAFRRIGGEQERIKSLHRDLLEFQRKGMNQFGKVSSELPLDDLYLSAIKSVRGKPLGEAIRALALICSPPKLDSLRQEVEEQRQDFPLLHMIPSFRVDGSGRTTDSTPSSMSDDQDDREKSDRAHLLRYASQMRILAVLGAIDPARSQILQEHYVRAQDLAPLVANNPFVPEGREILYASGLHAGLEGDYVVATHLLIPQLENSIRHVLSERGVITSHLDSAGIQDVHLLGSMLYRPEIECIFGKDMTFDLQGLLVERSGDNLRNRVAHGLMDGIDFSRTDAAYLWWLTLHLLFRICLAHEPLTEQ